MIEVSPYVICIVVTNHKGGLKEEGSISKCTYATAPTTLALLIAKPDFQFIAVTAL